jgi:hypothetical protein
MQPDVTSDAMMALLQILERIERPIDEVQISTTHRLVESRDEPEPPLADPKAAVQANRLVERIASAMLKLRVHDGYTSGNRIAIE